MFVVLPNKECNTMILRQFLHTDPVGISYLLFIRFMLAEIPPAPPEAARIREANSGTTAVVA